MRRSSGYAIDSKKSFPPVKGEIKRKGLSPEMKNRLRFMKTHTVEVHEDLITGEPYIIIKEKFCYPMYLALGLEEI